MSELSGFVYIKSHVTLREILSPKDEFKQLQKLRSEGSPEKSSASKKFEPMPLRY